MDPIKALLAGPPSYEPGPYIDWLFRTQQELEKSPHKNFSAISVPLKKSADLLVKMNTATEKEQEEAFGTIAAWMVEAQGLALYAFLDEFRKAADAVASEAKKQKAGTPVKEKFEKLDVAFREVFTVLRDTYNGVLEGKIEAWNGFPGAFEKAQALVTELKN